MIKVTTDEGRVSMKIHGNLQDLTADAIIIIREVYKSINEQDEEAGKHFKFVLKNAFRDGLLFMDDDDLADACAESAEKTKDEVKEDLSRAMNEKLDEAVEEIKRLAKELKGMTSDE